MMERFNVSYSIDAHNDLRVIYSYIANELLAPDTAKKQINRIRNAIRNLDFMPARHSIVDWEPWKSLNMHQFPVDNFVVYYLIDQDNRNVTVVRIFYRGRDVRQIVTVSEHK